MNVHPNVFTFPQKAFFCFSLTQKEHKTHNRLERHSLGMERRPRGRPNPMKKQKDNTRVFVQNLPPSYKWGDLKDLFKHNLPADLRTTVGERYTYSCFEFVIVCFYHVVPSNALLQLSLAFR